MEKKKIPDKVPELCKFVCNLCIRACDLNDLEPSCYYADVTGAMCLDMEHLVYKLESNQKLLEAWKKYLPALRKSYSKAEIKGMYDKYISEGKRSLKEFTSFLILNGIEVDE